MILSSKLLLLLYLASRCRVSISQMSCAGALLLRGPTATLCMSVCLWVSVCMGECVCSFGPTQRKLSQNDKYWE